MPTLLIIGRDKLDFYRIINIHTQCSTQWNSSPCLASASTPAGVTATQLSAMKHVPLTVHTVELLARCMIACRVPVLTMWLTPPSELPKWHNAHTAALRFIMEQSLCSAPCLIICKEQTEMRMNAMTYRSMQIIILSINETSTKSI